MIILYSLYKINFKIDSKLTPQKKFVFGNKN